VPLANGFGIAYIRSVQVDHYGFVALIGGSFEPLIKKPPPFLRMCYPVAGNISHKLFGKKFDTTIGRIMAGDIVCSVEDLKLGT
jgi:hypothetical protein